MKAITVTIVVPDDLAAWLVIHCAAIRARPSEVIGDALKGLRDDLGERIDVAPPAEPLELYFDGFDPPPVPAAIVRDKCGND